MLMFCSMSFQTNRLLESDIFYHRPVRLNKMNIPITSFEDIVLECKELKIQLHIFSAGLYMTNIHS